MVGRSGRRMLQTATVELPSTPPTPSTWLRQRQYESLPLFDLRHKQDPSLAYATHFAGLDDDSESLLSRQHELPPPASRVVAAVIVDTQADGNAAITALLSLGFSSVVSLLMADIHEQAPNLFRPATDENSPLHPSRALWSPSPSVVALLPQVMAGTTARTAIDVGCGSGRDAAFLACHGWDVVAVDRDRDLVEKAAQLGRRAWTGFGVDYIGRCGRVTGTARTLGSNLAEDSKWLSDKSANLLVVVRFLRRGVLELLPHAVAEGGWVIIEHFLTGCEKFGGPMKRSQMLERGELGHLFRPAGFTVLHEDEVFLADGRPVVRFLAVREAAV